MSRLVLLVKARVKAHTRKDGTFVQAYDNSRTASISGSTKPVRSSPTVRTKNDTYGFYGEASNQYLREKLGADDWLNAATEKDWLNARKAADKKFAMAASTLVSEGYFKSAEEARDYLDSKSGRHLHDAAPDGNITSVPWLEKDISHYKKRAAT